eukprot:15413566-Alexandrium_andersonii.AAC.1
MCIRDRDWQDGAPGVGSSPCHGPGTPVSNLCGCMEQSGSATGGTSGPRSMALSRLVHRCRATGTLSVLVHSA